MAVRIITDSGSDCLPGEHPNLDVLPLSIAFGDTTYSADVDLTRERFYELLVEAMSSRRPARSIRLLSRKRSPAPRRRATMW